MTDALEFIVMALAVYRVSALIAIEDGPFDVMASLRGRVNQSSWFGRGVRCVVCVSFWLAIPAAWIISPPAVSGAGSAWVTWLGLTGAVSVVHRALTR